MTLRSNILYFIVLIMLFGGCSSKNNIGIIGNKLISCPSSPNCISSFEAKENESYVEPIYYPSNFKAKKVLNIISKSVDNLVKSTLVEKEDNYLRFEFRTLLGFVDDVEFLIKEESNQIHIRSASRIGYYDFKKNRNRYFQIKRMLEELLVKYNI